MYCSRKTTQQSQQSHCIVLSEQICDSSTGQGERAIVERPVATDHLQDTVGLSNEWREKTTTNVSFCLFRLTLDEERLRTQVSTGDTCFARDTYPNPVGYYLLMPCHLNKCSETYLQAITQAFRTFHNYLHITHKTVHDTQGLCNGHPSLVLGQSIQSLEYGLYLAVP
jgi:hypothetical protein